MDPLESVEDGEIAETTPPLPASADESFQVPYQPSAAALPPGDNSSNCNVRYGSDQYPWASSSDSYERRQQHKGFPYPAERTPDLPRNQTGQPLLLSGQSSHPPRHPYPRYSFPNSSHRNRGRGGRPMPPPPNFPDKRPFYPRGIPPRSNYSQPWNSGKPANNFPHPPPVSNEHPDYSRGASNYYGPPSTTIPPGLPRHPPPSLSSPALAPTMACGPPQAKNISPPPSASPIESAPPRPQPIATSSSLPPPSHPAKAIVEDETTKPKPHPLIQVVSDPNLTLDPPKTTAPPKLPPSGQSNPKPYPPSRPSYLHPSHHTSPTKVSITRLIDHVAAPSLPAPPTPLPLAVTIGLHEEASVSLLNLPPPPSLEGPSESSGSVSSRSRPRVAWGQGLRRKSSGPVDMEVSQTPSSPKAEKEIDADSFQTETQSPPEMFLEIEEDPIAEKSMEVIGTEEPTKCENVPGATEQEHLSSEMMEALTVVIPTSAVEPVPHCEATTIESPRSRAKPGRPPASSIPAPEDPKSANKKTEKKSDKKKPDPKALASRKKSFDETNDSDSDGNKAEEGKKRRTLSRGNAGDSDKESVEDEAPRKKRGRPPSGAFKPGQSSPVGDDLEKDRDQQQSSKGARGKSGRSKAGRPKSDSESISSYQILPPPPVKRRSRSFGSFERDSLGGLFSSVPDLRNAYYALQGMVRIQVSMRGVSGFNKEDLMGLNQMLQNPQSVVNLPIPYTSEIVMCLEIIEAKSYQYGDAMTAIQLLKREIEDLARHQHHHIFKSNSTEGDSAPAAADSAHRSASSPMGLVKKSVIKSEGQSPSKKSAAVSLWPESLVQQFMIENMKRVSTAEICAHVHFPPSPSPAEQAEQDLLETVVNRGRADLERNRSVVLAEIRRRKLARTQAWEILADRYVAVKHRWDHYQEKNSLPVAGEEEVLGPRLRAMSSMRNILGPRAPARLSTMRATSDILLQDQDRVMQQLAMKELMARRLAVGICPIPDMLSPWQHSDPSVPPKPPSWPPSDMYLPGIDPEEKYTCPPESFPKSVGDSPVIIDINGCRLTTDGRRPLCAVQPSCPPNCNCALQVDREERQFHPWSDMEKTIFLDKFMQFPKNFSKIAAFLTNRTTKDCVKFYYDSKTTIPYKALLREFDNRKRHLRNSWTHSCAAANSVGGVLYPPDADEKEHVAELPTDDVTYRTFGSHPLYMATALGFDGDDDSERGAYRKKQMTDIQHRAPRERTQLLSFRKELRRECCKFFEGNGLPPPSPPSGGLLRTFIYPADARNSSGGGSGTDHCEGYGQSADSWIPGEGSNTRLQRRHREPAGNLPKDMASAKEIDAALARGRGRGRRGRRPNTISRGAGRPSSEVPPPALPEIKLSPLARGRGRGRGRWSSRGRGRGRGRGDDDASQGKDDDDAFGPTDESFEVTGEELDYEVGEEEDEEYDGQPGPAQDQNDDEGEEINTKACEEPALQDDHQEMQQEGDGKEEESLVVSEVIASLMRAVAAQETHRSCSGDPCPLPLLQSNEVAAAVGPICLPRLSEANGDEELSMSPDPVAGLPTQDPGEEPNDAQGPQEERATAQGAAAPPIETKRKFSEVQRDHDADREGADDPLLPCPKHRRPDETETESNQTSL